MRVNLAFRETLRQVFHLWEILDGMRRNKKRQGCCWNVGISPSHSSTLPWRSPTFAPVSDSPIPLMVSRQHHQPKVAELSLAAARLGVDGVCIYICVCVCPKRNNLHKLPTWQPVSCPLLLQFHLQVCGLVGIAAVELQVKADWIETQAGLVDHAQGLLDGLLHSAFL